MILVFQGMVSAQVILSDIITANDISLLISCSDGQQILFICYLSNKHSRKFIFQNTNVEYSIEISKNLVTRSEKNVSCNICK